MIWLLWLSLAFAGRETVWLPEADLRYDGEVSGEIDETPWWESFDDPALSEVITEALDNNGDLGAAWARVQSSHAVAMQAGGPLLPQLSGNVNWQVAPLDSLGFGFGLGDLPTDPTAPEPPELYTQSSATLNAQWNLDLWGRQYLTHRAGIFDAMAAEGDKDAQAIALASRVGGAYLDVVQARAQVAVVKEQVAANEDLLELVELRYEATDATGIEVLQQRQQVAATRAALPQARGILRATEYQLSAVLGRHPNEALPELPGALPELPPTPSTGQPTDLLESRPDLEALEDRLSSAHKRKLAAQRAFLPTVGASGTAGWQQIDRGDPTDQTYWNAGIQISVPLFTGGSTYHGMRAARGQEDAAARQFEQAVRTAIAEVEGAVATEEEQQANLEAVRAQAEAAGLAYEEARQQYADGVGTYLSVLTALSSHQQAQISALSAQRSLLGARISLHESLGGTWTHSLNRP